MRWGKKKANNDSKKSMTVNNSNRGSKKTYGGKSPHRNLNVAPKSVDAQKAINYKSRAKTSGTDALSTKELKALVERMNLEAQYDRLNPPQLSLGKQLVATVMPTAGALLWENAQARKPQQPVSEQPVSTALAKPSTKQVVGDILLSTGKQVIAKHGIEIGMAIAKGLLK
jgi:hypothetical protein